MIRSPWASRNPEPRIFGGAGISGMWVDELAPGGNGGSFIGAGGGAGGCSGVGSEGGMGGSGSVLVTSNPQQTQQGRVFSVSNPS